MSEDVKHTLYLCYFGYREPLVHTQVIPYLKEVAKDGNKISLLTFEPNFRKTWTAEQIKQEKEKLEKAGIKWYCLPYHKSPSLPATIFDILAGVRFIKRLMKTEKIDVLHARSHVSTLMAVLAKDISRKSPKILFDIRGFMPEEYTDAGVWKKNGVLFRGVKAVESWLLKKADGFVVLTEKAREILFPESSETGFDKHGRPVEVIPCCVDLQRFENGTSGTRQLIRQKYNLENRRVIAYVGSFGGWYLTDEMTEFFRTAKEQDPSTFAMILTQSKPEEVFDSLKQKGLTEDDFLITKVAPSEIPKYLSASDMAISFIKVCYSKLSSSPTKIAEYLAKGIPIITNRGIGDVAEVIEKDRVGVVIDNFDAGSYLRALNEVDKLRASTDLQTNCRVSARKRFDLEEVGGQKYRRLYRRLLADRQPAAVEKLSTLYICYFGLNEPLVQTQVLPYLRQIRDGGIKVSLLTFEPNPTENWSREQTDEARKRLAAEGIDWHFLTYHKRPSAPATLYDTLTGAKFALRMIREKKVNVLHARSQVPMTMALLVKALTNCQVVFDIRGLMAEEYADSGIWKEGSIPFRTIKGFERIGLKYCEQAVVLTAKMRDYLYEKKLRREGTVEVIPCCVDFSRIKSNGKTAKSERFELIYAGSVTGLYLLEEMGRFFLQLKKRKPDAFFRVLTASAPEIVDERFQSLGIAPSDYQVQKVAPAEVLTYLSQAHLAISFRKPTFSQIAASPTKVPEYLAAGLPVVFNQGVGDTDSLLREKSVGTIVDDFEDSTLLNAVDQSLGLMEDETLPIRCKETALDNFDLRKTGKGGYLNVYERLAKTSG